MVNLETNLMARMNGHFELGVKLYSKRILLDWALKSWESWSEVESLLLKWQSRGFIKIIKPPALALDFEPVIEMRDYIKEAK